jgi:hypothetical protein
MIRYSDKDNLIDKYNQLGKRVLYFKWGKIWKRYLYIIVIQVMVIQ